MKYKKLRNQVNSKIRSETKDFNNNRIDRAGNENEVWKIANEISNPQKANDWSLKSDKDALITDHEDIPNAFKCHGLEYCSKSLMLSNFYEIDAIAGLFYNIIKVMMKGPN